MLPNLFQKNISKDKIAEMLKVSPEKLKEFEEAYKTHILTDEIDSDNLFDINSRQASKDIRTRTLPKDINQDYIETICNKITNELLSVQNGYHLPEDIDNSSLVTNNDLAVIPEEIRPQLTGTLLKKDIAIDSNHQLLEMLYRSMTTKNPKKALDFYHMFRQGLDILDLDPITYEILGMNRNSIEHWFAPLKAAAQNQNFFKIPKTKIVRVPLPILQLTRLDYKELTPATLKIVDDWAIKAFDLDVNKKYFIKTGTYSSKFDFRNACVTGEKEIRELGEYLLFIHFQANQMAGPLSSPCIYGVSTTNTWVVREFIEDKENNPTIYKGLPLHTEYRIFVDMDTKEVLGIAPYWEPTMMEKRFSENRNIHDTHDYITFKAHKDILMKRYNQNKNNIVNKIESLIKAIDLHDQWSIDIMQNGDEFWIIDMALAENSALREYIPREKQKTTVENWIPILT